MISIQQVAVAAPSRSTLTIAVTFTSSRIRSCETLYGASGSIELTSRVISATRRKYQEGLNFTSQELWTDFDRSKNDWWHECQTTAVKKCFAACGGASGVACEWIRVFFMPCQTKILQRKCSEGESQSTSQLKSGN